MTATAEESVVLAALIRAPVAVALRDAERAEPVPDPSAEVMRAAYWRAARDGPTGSGLDVGSGKRVVAADLVDRTVAYALPAPRS